MNLFELAAVKKYRFKHAFNASGFTVEQLFELPLKSKTGAACLNSVAITINDEIKKTATEDFVDESPTDAKTDLNNQLDIVKHVIKHKQEANEKARNRLERSAERKKLRDALVTKDEAKLEKMSEAQILKRLEELD